jgi:hypothetical protein
VWVSYDRARFQDKWRIERLARSVREQLGLDQFAVVDPWRLADDVPAHVFYPEDLVSPALAARVRHVEWDGFGFCPPGESVLIVLLNPARSAARQTATMMEEFSHHLLQHQPTRMFTDSITGLLRRDFNPSQEHEAYDLGATILLPKELIQRDVNAGLRAAEVAAERNCSVRLVEYRIQRCRLWGRYLGKRSA